MLDILEYLHGVILPIEYLSHDLHVALRYILLIPQFLEIYKSLIDSLFLSLLILSIIRLIPYLIYH